MENQVRPLKTMEKMPDLINKYWQDVWERKKNGGLVAWVSGASPFQVLSAMDIQVVWPEGYGSLCSAAGASGELCQQAETLGYSPDLCSVLRNQIGSTHGNIAPEKLPWGGLPDPDIMVCQPYCPGIYKMWKKWSEFFNVPLLVMERGRIHDAFTKEECTQLVNDGIEELQEIIIFLERFTGRRFDHDRLSQRLAFERKASDLRLDGVEMCRNIPAPMSMFDAFANIFPWYLRRGTPEAVTYYQELKDELAERVAHKTGSLMGEEKYRLYWDNLPVYYKTEELTQKFASYSAVPVVAYFPYVFGFDPGLDLKNPLKYIVEFNLLSPLNRGLTGRIEWINKMVEGFSLDGFVMQRSRTCLMNNMGQENITETLIEKTGLPAVVIEGDLCDPRFYSDSEVNGKIDAFMEILALRKSSMDNMQTVPIRS